MAITFQFERTPSSAGGAATEANQLPPFAILQGDYSYPTQSDLIFGTDYAHSDYVIPIARFSFYNANGEKTTKGAPNIYMKLGGSFQSGLSNPFSPAQNIYGNPGTSLDAGIIGTIKAAGEGFSTALLKQAIGGVAGIGGAFASAGQSGKQNVEFLQRKLFNQFQQLIYNGPNFRQFTLPFAMKPTSYEEAKVMRNILATFRIASSPVVGAQVDVGVDQLDVRVPETASAASILESTGVSANQAAAEAQARADAAKAGTVTQTDYDQLISSSYTTKTFGYPDMCRFQIVLYQKDVQEFPVLFESDLCVIENVNIDYGGQSKMTFFKPPSGTGQYFPTEVTLNIGLKETSLITATYASTEVLNQPNRTIL